MEVTRVFDLLDRFHENFPKADALAAKRNNEWVKFSTADYIEFSNYFSYGIMALGFSKGDKIATITNNRPEWNFADMGMAQVGVVHVPVYPTLNPEDYRYILSHAEVKAVLISEKALYTKIKPICDEIGIQLVYTFNPIDGIQNWNEIIKLGKDNEEKYRESLLKIKASINPDDLFTIIYTSGTTGSPKGVMLSHKNLISNFIASSKLQPLDHNHKVLSFLPVCHVYERMITYHYQYKGISIYFAENMGTIAANLVEIKADGFTTVPRLLEKVYDKIVSKGKDLTGFKKHVFFWALKLSHRYEFNRANGWWYELQRSIADKLVYSKWRDALGGNVKVIVSGGSALQPRLARVFWCAGLRIMEGYGLTETSPVIAVSHAYWPNIKFGTVGPILEGVIVKFDEDGEILIKGPNLMLGYYQDPEYTASVIDEDGWFHTGDVGILEDGKFLKITDRKKEIFKLSAGKYIAPQVLENKFKESIFIEQIVVVGENEKFASGLISPNFNHLHYWAMKHKIHFRDNEELITIKDVYNRIEREVEKVNKTLSPHEQIKRFRLVSEEWTPQTGELSPTLKLRRNILYQKYSGLLEEIFGHPHMLKQTSAASGSAPIINLNVNIKDKLMKNLGGIFKADEEEPPKSNE
ncbi:MAG: long-chain fatty acid--CoA ligase [Bacteroidales bacterium]|nr:long-chain fatty acid--CoA ligase [Bacteroidales bacterium]